MAAAKILPELKEEMVSRLRQESRQIISASTRNQKQEGQVGLVGSRRTSPQGGRTRVSSQQGEEGGFPRSCWTGWHGVQLSERVTCVGMLNVATAVGSSPAAAGLWANQPPPGHHSPATGYPRQPHHRSKASSSQQSPAASEPQAGIA